MAEAELRRALAYPRYEPPPPPGLPPAARSAVRLSRPLLAPLLPPVPTAARMSGSLLGPWWPVARTAASAARQTASAARQTPLGRVAEPVLWRVLRVRRAIRPLLPGPGRAAPHRAEVALDRVRQVAGTLVSAGVISEAGACEVLQNLTDAFALRGKLSASQMYWPPGGAPWGPRFRWPGAGPTRPPLRWAPDGPDPGRQPQRPSGPPGLPAVTGPGQ